MMQEYGKNPVQDTIVLPFLCVRMDGFDPGSFLDVSGRQWNDYLILKSLGITFSVLEFSQKMQKLFLNSGAAWRSLALGFWSHLYEDGLGLSFWSKESLHWWNEYLIFMYNFSHVFYSNHGKTFHFWLCTNLECPMRVYSAQKDLITLV